MRSGSSPLSQPPINPSWLLFAVPTADYSGAWIIKRGGNRPTFDGIRSATLGPGPPPFGVSTAWTDVSAPEVEAIHPAQSGT
jgi:hypothetical protein